MELNIYYFRWHYGRAFSDIVRIWTNFIWFIWNFFSIGLLLRTFFSPFKRMDEERKKGLYVQNIIDTVIVNTLMRIVGALFRMVVIFFGLIALVAVLVGGVLFFAVWLVFPALLVVALIAGFFRLIA